MIQNKNMIIKTIEDQITILTIWMTPTHCLMYIQNLICWFIKALRSNKEDIQRLN
jgi:hypothetical protein